MTTHEKHTKSVATGEMLRDYVNVRGEFVDVPMPRGFFAAVVVADRESSKKLRAALAR